MSWVPHVMILYSLGSMAMLLAVRIEDMGRYFFKFIGTVALLFTLVGALAMRDRMAALDPAGCLLIAYSAAVFFFNILVRFPTEKISRLWIVMTVLVGINYVSFELTASHPAAPAVGLILHHTASALVLGVSLVTMILGHWYLVQEHLSFDVLKRCIVIFLAVLGIKAAISVAGMAVHWPARVDDLTLLLILLRGAVGLAANFALGVMVYRCARIHSNQSATGILYVVTLFSLIGELTSMYLTMVRSLVV